MFLKSKAAASKEYNTNFWEAISGAFTDEYWKADCNEIYTLEKMIAWYVIDRTDDVNLIDFTCDLRLKHSPEVLISKFKACFCVSRDWQLEGEKKIEIYSPVMQVTNFHLKKI